MVTHGDDFPYLSEMLDYVYNILYTPEFGMTFNLGLIQDDSVGILQPVYKGLLTLPDEKKRWTLGQILSLTEEEVKDMYGNTEHAPNTSPELVLAAYYHMCRKNNRQPLSIIPLKAQISSKHIKDYLASPHSPPVQPYLVTCRQHHFLILLQKVRKGIVVG